MAQTDPKTTYFTPKRVERKFSPGHNSIQKLFVRNSEKQCYTPDGLSAGQTSSRRRGGFAAGKTPHKTYYYTQDGLGSVRTLSDTSGTIKNKYDYSAFGTTYAPTTLINIPNRYTYTGREQNPVSATMYYRWRVYSAGVGRFVSRDPSGYPNNERANLYDYVYSNATLSTDPLGLRRGDVDIGTPWFDRGSYLNPICHDYTRPGRDGSIHTWGSKYKASVRRGHIVRWYWYQNGNCEI